MPKLPALVLSTPVPVANSPVPKLSTCVPVTKSRVPVPSTCVPVASTRVRIPSFCVRMRILCVRNRKIRCFSRSTLVLQDHAVTTHSPAVFVIYKKRVEVLLDLALLLQPRLAAVVRAQDDAAATNYPATLVVNELYARQSITDGYVDPLQIEPPSVVRRTVPRSPT